MNTSRNNPPEYQIEEGKLAELQQAFDLERGDRDFGLVVSQKSEETGTLTVYALPFTVKEQTSEKDAGVWMATMALDLCDVDGCDHYRKELLSDAFMTEVYIRPVKRAEDVQKSVAMWVKRSTRGTVFKFHVSAVDSDGSRLSATQATKRMRAALKRFSSQLIAWLSGREMQLFAEADKCLRVALSRVS